jgi:hypothetical protein
MQGIHWPPLPDMGVLSTWPQEGIEAIHPDDRPVAEQLIPSNRVLRRTEFDGVYYRMEYGNQSFRLKPSLWLQVRDEGFRIGDRVEVPSRMMQADPMIATILEMRLCQDQGCILYGLQHNEMPFPHDFKSEELILLTSHAHLQASDFQAPIPKQDPVSDS